MIQDAVAIARSMGHPQPGACHVLVLSPPYDSDDHLELVSQDELARASRFVHETDRSTYFASRALQRVIGAAVSGLRPEGVVIARDCWFCGGAHGPPRWVGSDLHYSVAHSSDHLVIAMASDGPLGVDVESAKRAASALSATTRALSPGEAAHFGSMPEGMRTDWLCHTWVRKEAVSKALGLGLAADLNVLDVRADSITLEGGARGTLHLTSLRLASGAMLAVASPSRCTLRMHVFS